MEDMWAITIWCGESLKIHVLRPTDSLENTRPVGYEGNEIPLSHFINAPGIYWKLIQAILFDYDVVIARHGDSWSLIPNSLQGVCSVQFTTDCRLCLLSVHNKSYRVRRDKKNYDWGAAADNGNTFAWLRHKLRNESWDWEGKYGWRRLVGAREEVVGSEN